MSGASINCPSPAKEVSRPRPSWASALVSHGCRYLIGIVFLMAAISKIVNLREFENEVLLHSSLPHVLARVLPSVDVQMSFTLARIVPAVLPWLELTCGLCLIFRWAVRESAFLAALLLSLFIAQSISSRSEDCHCFFFPNVASTLPWWWHPIRDGLFLLCSIYLIWGGLPRNTESR